MSLRAAVPFYIGPNVDISADVIKALNARAAEKPSDNPPK
jgi:hypothetical protein